MKKMTEKEKTIQNYMKKLDLSREEAEQMWQDEQEDNLPELTAEQKAVEKEMLRADRKKEETPRKRERKADEDKRFLISKINDALHLYACASVVNPEREIEIIYHGNRYRLTLAKPRKEKNA
jgi:predicted RNA-binding protein Jag